MAFRSLAERFGGEHPACCLVCRRHAFAIGTTRFNRPPIYWLCDDPVCLKHGKDLLDMPAKALDALERKARRMAGEDAGEYLDQLGKTDLAELSETEWIVFSERIITGFERAMRELVASGEAPF